MMDLEKPLIAGFPKLGVAGKAAEIRWAFFEVGISSFLSFFGHIKKHGCIACQFLQAGLAVAVSIHCGFQAPESNW